MSIKKNNTYFQENNGKVYYYDENGGKHDIPASAFGDLQEQIESIGKPLTYSGNKSVSEINALEEIKQGTVYTITGESGTISAGEIDVKQGDEVAWAEPNWVEIGKDIDNSWKQWSEDNGSTGNEHSIYIGKDNNVSSNQYNNSVAIGDNNSSYNGSVVIGKSGSATEGALSIGGFSNTSCNGAVSIGHNNLASAAGLAVGQGNTVIQGGGAFGNGNYGGKGGYVIGDSNLVYSGTWDSQTETVNWNNLWIREGNMFGCPSQFAFGYSNYLYSDYGPRLSPLTPFQIGYNNQIYSYLNYENSSYYFAGLNAPASVFQIGRSNSAVGAGINIGIENIILTGDSTVAGSINIGKRLRNKFGVLIGQNISSYGYGFGIGSDIPYVGAGDNIFGFDININSGRVGSYPYYTSRTVIGRYIEGVVNNDGNIFGSYITSYSGYVPTGNENWCNGIGNGSIVIGTHIKGAASNGSMIIAQNGENADRCGANTMPIIANNDSTIIGGYTRSPSQSSDLNKPGISADSDGVIIGQGQQMSAGYHSLILGNESYAYQNGKVIGSHGYATNDSMVINYPSLYVYNQYINVYTINGLPISGNIQINYNPYANKYTDVKYLNYYYDENNKLVLSANTSNVFSGEFLDGAYYYYRKHYYLESNDKNYAVAVFNLDASYSQDNIVTGTWINSGRDFQENDEIITTGTETAYKLTGWSGNPMILINDNGTRNFYVYSALSNTDKSAMPHYFKIRKDFYGYYNNNLVTDKKYLYVYNDYSNNNPYIMEQDVPSSLLCTSSTINSVLKLNNDTVYEYTDNTFSVGEHQNITGYEWNGQSASKLGSVQSSVYPSAIFSADIRKVVTNSTADQASLAVGPGNSAIGGSVAINGCQKFNHNLVNSSNQEFYGNYTLNSTGGMEWVYNSAIFDTKIINEPINKASYNSIAIGIGTKGGWMNSASDYSLAIGSKVTAGWNSIGIGQTLSATDYSYAFGNDAVTADNFAFAFGNHGVSSKEMSFALGHDGISADHHSYVLGHHGVYADCNSFAFGGQGITAKNQGMAFGYYGVYAENIDSNPGGYGQGWGIAIGSNGVTSKNGGIAFGYNGVYSENKGCIALGASGVIANASPAFAIGSHGIEAYQGLSFGVKGKARNQSINLTMSNLNTYFASIAENVSINMITTDGYNNTTARNHSINIGTTRYGNSLAENGSITLMADSTSGGYYAITSRNQSIVLATKHYMVDGDYLCADNNSLIIGAGTDSTSAKNDSIAIGFGRETYANNSYIYNGSVTIGHANTANGGVWLIGSKNYIGSTYTANDDTHPIDYSQTIVMGESNTACNYRPYLYAPYSAYSADKYLSGSNIISNDKAKSAHGWSNDGYSVTRSMIIGNYNCLSGYNTFIFGLNNTAGQINYGYNIATDSISGDPNDDGFVYIFGLNNRAVRNYDMAIGYNVLASGGENIAIGAPQINENYGTLLYNTQAIGYKNISIRSNIYGADNIAINTLFTGDILTAAGMTARPELYHTKNHYSNSNLTINCTNGYSYANIHHNHIHDNNNLTADVNSLLDSNRIIDNSSIYLSGAFTHNDFIHNKSLRLLTRYTSDGIENNYIAHSQLTAYFNEVSNNIFNAVSGYITGGNVNNNLLYSTNINFNGGADSWYAFSNNFAFNSNISSTNRNELGMGQSFIFNSSASYDVTGYSYGGNGQDVLFYSNLSYSNENEPDIPGAIRYVGRYGGGYNLLFGVNATNCHNFVAFGDPAGEVTVGSYVNRTFNYGDYNQLTYITDSNVFGNKNIVYGLDRLELNGTQNVIINNDLTTDDQTFIHNLIVHGDDNTITTNNYNQITNAKAYNTIHGNHNKLVFGGYINHNIGDINLTGDITNNTIIGGSNGFYNLTNIDVTSATIYTTYSNYSTIGNTAYGSINNSRNTIIGNKEIISKGINDTILIGNSNIVFNKQFNDVCIKLDQAEDFSTNSSYNTGDIVIGNCWGNLYYMSATRDIVAGQTWKNVSSYFTSIYSLSALNRSDNYSIGSYNLIYDGSNQINIGNCNITSGFNATAIGEGLIAKTSQMVVGRLNAELDGTNGLYETGVDNTTGALFIVGNGIHKNNDYESSACVRSNAMIVSADGTVSAKRFIESDPALTITGGNFVSVTEDQQNNLLTIDLETSLGQMLTELSGVLTAKPSTGRHILGVENGSLTWLEVNQ